MKKRRKFYIILVLSTFTVLSIPRMITLISVYKKLHWYQREITRLKDENKILEDKINKIKSDPYYTERMLRENFGMIKKGETVYRIKER
ncbi:septum formation initiator family protein [bacterium]|nr:septum formation initiator family protein [bacterium]